MPAARPFAAALSNSKGAGPAVIAEIKRRSPSKGLMAPDLDPALLATRYEVGGAACLSVLTEAEFFAGSVRDLQLARSAVALPVLRKDFTVSAHDLADARLMGADAVLLIVAALEQAELRDFQSLGGELGMAVLVEVHDERELERAVDVGAVVIGVNQRDLVTFEVDSERAARLAPLMPPGVVRVAESGVRGPADAAQLHEAGFDAILVGESLVRSDDPAVAVRRLIACS